MQNIKQQTKADAEDETQCCNVEGHRLDWLKGGLNRPALSASLKNKRKAISCEKKHSPLPQELKSVTICAACSHFCIAYFRLGSALVYNWILVYSWKLQTI